MNQDSFADKTPRPPVTASAGAAPAGSFSNRLIARHPWLPFLLPFLVYMVVGSFEPKAPKPRRAAAKPPVAVEAPPPIEPDAADRRVEPPAQTDFGPRYKRYPLIYTAKIALTIAAMLLVLPGYRQFPLRVSPLAVGVGVVGVVLWVWICSLQLERALLVPLGLEKMLGLGERPAYNPLAQLADTPRWAYTFLAIRFLGLALVVPIIEEFFLRGFVMRFVQQERWWEVPFGQVTLLAAVLGTAVPMLMHPAELFAAAVWFSMVTWLMVRTRNLWDCVAAHAVTNLLLGIYVVTHGQWQLW